MKDRILYWGRMQLPDKNALAHRVIANCCAMQRCGYNPVLIGYSMDTVSNDIISTKYNVNGFDAYELPYPKNKADWLSDSKNYKQIEKIINAYGESSVYAIVFTGIGVGNNKGLLKISKRYGIPLVRDIVDWFEYDKGNFLYRIVKTLETNTVVNHYTPKVHNVICISRFLKSYFDKKGCNTVIIPSLSHKGDVRFENLPEYRREGKIKISYVGNPGKRGEKDRIDWCIRAFNDCMNKSCEMHICGISKEEFCNDFPEYKDMAESDNIYFYGRVSNRTCVELIAASDYFVFAREDKQATKAGFPTKLSEAFAIGTPVITTPSGDVSMYIKNGTNGFVSDSCSFESFQKTFYVAISASDDKIIDMHSICKKDSPLYETHWATVIDEYLKTV